MNDAGNFADILDIVFLAVLWIVAQPLKTAIAALQSSIQDLAEEIKELRRRAADNRVEIAKISESVKDAHFRINELDKRVNEVEHKCERCICKNN